jgi:polysaccharide export outer membrane protein
MCRLKSLALLPLTLLVTMGTLAADQGAASDPAPGSNAEPPAYRIGPGDVLQIDVWKEPDASNPSVTVRPDGRISLAIIGEVQVAGRTPAELKATLSEKFGELIRGARVTVTVRDVNSQKIYLIGEVRREGLIRLAGPTTVLQALAEAGGITDYAKRKRIYILRIVNGRQVNLPFDYDAVVRGQKVDQNVMLVAGDTIVVPR